MKAVPSYFAGDAAFFQFPGKGATDPAGQGVETTADFHATIDWGDSKTDFGTVVSLGGGLYRVDAPSHTYMAAGQHTVTVTVKHDQLPPLLSAGKAINVTDAPPVNTVPTK